MSPTDAVIAVAFLAALFFEFWWLNSDIWPLPKWRRRPRKAVGVLITLPACEAFLARCFVGTAVVGCLKHECVQTLLEAGTWYCPVCGFHPSGDAPLYVTAIDWRAGTITVG